MTENEDLCVVYEGLSLMSVHHHWRTISTSLWEVSPARRSTSHRSPVHFPLVFIRGSPVSPAGRDGPFSSAEQEEIGGLGDCCSPSTGNSWCTLLVCGSQSVWVVTAGWNQPRTPNKTPWASFPHEMYVALCSAFSCRKGSQSPEIGRCFHPSVSAGSLSEYGLRSQTHRCWK